MNGYYDPNQQWQGFSGNPNYLNTNTSIPNAFRQQSTPQPQAILFKRACLED